MTTKILAAQTVQHPSRASGTVAWNQLKADGTAISAIGTHDLVLAVLPQYAIITAGAIVVRTAWANAAGTVTIDVGDSDPTADPDRYTGSPLNLKSAAVAAITAANYRTGAQCNLTAQIVVATAAATAGEMSWWVDYYVEGRAHENMG